MQLSQTRHALAVLAGLVLAAGPVLAQDSTSQVSGLPGDSLDPRSTSEQCKNFVVELSVFQSSFGNTFGLAPLLKASTDHQPSPNFFNALISANAISADLREGVPFARASYDRWSGPGFGVKPGQNQPGTPIDTSSAFGSQFGVVMAEFSSDDPQAPAFEYGNIIGAVVNFDPDAPSRLYVSRVVGAINGPDWLCTTSAFGLGSVDADGNVHLRADGFGTSPCGVFSSLLGNNYFRTSLLGRDCGGLNFISDSGGTNATTWPLSHSGTIHNVPNMIPAAIGGALSVMLGSNFSGQYVHGVSAPLSTTTAHLGGASDHRGGVAYQIHSFPGLFGAGAVNGTGGILSRTGGTNNRISMFGLGSGGAPVGALSRQLPASVADPETGFSAGGTWGHIYSQTAYRGGSSPLALGRDRSGRLLAAAVLNHGSVTAPAGHAKNLIAVARVSSLGTDWSAAAYTNGANGKPIQDGAGNVIGRLVELNVISSTNGPSISPPMIDSAGNVLFVSSFQLNSGPQGLGLFRAVYDGASFSYRLELLLRTGQIFRGGTSDVPFLVRRIELTDPDSIDSGAPFSHAIRQGAHNGLNPGALAPSDPRTLGGLVLSVNLIYDVDGNGVFEDIRDVPGTADQNYNVLLYIGAAEDCNGNGVPDDLDILLGNSQDVDGDGIPDECGPYIEYCNGDTGCGCLDNDGSLGVAGCANSAFPSGCRITVGGTYPNAVTIGAQNMQPNQFGVVLRGTSQMVPGMPVLDGLLCVQGQTSRSDTFQSNAQGLATSPVLPQGPAGVQWFYQVWYRDVSLCSGSNLSNGVGITW